MFDTLEWKFIESHVEAHISGKTIKRISNNTKSGLFFRVNKNADLEIRVVGCIREFKFLLKKEVLTVSWRFYKQGKLTILTRSKVSIYLSRAQLDLIILFIKCIYDLFPSCLNPYMETENLTSNLGKSFFCSEMSLYKETIRTVERENKLIKLDKLNIRNFQDYECKYLDENFTTNTKDYFSNLPEDLLFYIFSMIERKKSLCDIKRSESDNSFFKDKLIGLTNALFTNRRLLNFMLSNMWEISIERSKNKYFIFNKNFENLKSILLINNDMKDMEIRNLSTYRNLPTSIVKFSLINQRNVTDSTLRIFLLRFKELECLEILDCRKISEKILFQIMKMNRSLKYLKIGNRNKSNYTIKDESLNILSQTNYQDDRNMNLHQGCVDFPKLLHFELLNCVKITKLSFLIEHTTNLEYLDLRGCINISDEEFQRLFEFLKNLKVLILSNNSANDRKMDIVFNNCKQLEILDISDCTSISEQTIEKMSFNLKKIIGIKLSFCVNLNIKSFLNILSECKQIELIDLTGCFNIETTLFNYRVGHSISSLRKVGIHRLSLDSRKFKQWLIEGSTLNLKYNGKIEIIDDQEIPISEFTQKYEIRRRQDIERNRPIWKY